MKLYHSTTYERADEIERAGFRDSASVHAKLIGVWLADTPGAYGAAVFEFDVPDDIAASHHLEYDDDDAPKEWCIPSAILNTLTRRRVDDVVLEGAAVKNDEIIDIVKRIEERRWGDATAIDDIREMSRFLIANPKLAAKLPQEIRDIIARYSES